MKTYVKGYDENRSVEDALRIGEHPRLGITEVTDGVPTHINKVIVHGDLDLRDHIITVLNAVVRDLA